jgi:hypothetical protein
MKLSFVFLQAPEAKEIQWSVSLLNFNSLSLSDLMTAERLIIVRPCCASPLGSSVVRKEMLGMR